MHNYSTCDPGFGHSWSSPRGTGIWTLAFNGSYIWNRSNIHPSWLLLLLRKKVCKRFLYKCMHLLSRWIYPITLAFDLQCFWGTARVAPSFWSGVTKGCISLLSFFGALKWFHLCHGSYSKGIWLVISKSISGDRKFMFGYTVMVP